MSDMSARPKVRLPRGDFVILPSLSLLTVLALFLVSEAVVRFVCPDKWIDSCAIRTTEARGNRYKLNCSSKVKLVEGPWVQNNYNECGYRSAASCSAKPPGTIRIAIIGTSFALGFMVPYEQSFGALAEKELTRGCGRPVEIQNLSVIDLRPWQLASLVDEALALKPDAVAIMLSPLDVELDWDPEKRIAVQEERPGVPVRSKSPSFRQAMAQALPFIFNHSRALLMMRHFVYQDPEVYLRIFLRTHDEQTNYLRPSTSPLELRRMSNADKLVADMADKIHSQNTPVLLMPALLYAQVALLNSPKTIPGLDPRAFESELGSIASKHGIIFLPVADDFAHVPHSEALFYVADGHNTAQGQAIYARSLVRQIIGRGLLEPFGCAVRSPH